MQTIIELPGYLKEAACWLNPSERADIIVYLALHPTAGSLIRGTGGVRKLRWHAQSKGKRGGVRIIYYYHNETLPFVSTDHVR